MEKSRERSRRDRSRSRERSRSRGRGRERRDSYRERPPDRRREDGGRRRAYEGDVERGGREGGERRHAAAQNLSQEPPEVGSIHRARVQGVRPFGVFLQLQGYAKSGLAHNSQVSEELSFSREDDDDLKVKGMEFYFPEGSEAWAKVVEVREEGPGNFKIACSLKVVDQESGKDLDPQGVQAGGRGGGGGGGGPPGGQRGGPTSDEPPPAGAVLKASVASIKPYGVFVRLEGYGRDGLVHFSQVSNHLEFGKNDSDEEKAEALSSVHAVGDPLFVKVTEVREEEVPSGRGPRIACSIKVVNQRTGKDLDPENVEGSRGPQGGGGRGAERGKVGASVGAVQGGGEVEWGHLQAEGVKLPTSDKYALISSADIAVLPPPPPPPGGSRPPAAQAPEAPMTTEEALAILQRAEKDKKKKKKDKGKDKEKKGKKEGKEKKAKHKNRG